MKSLTLEQYFNKLPADKMSPRTRFVKQLAEECRVDESTVYRWIRGKAKPNELCKTVISRMTNIPIESIQR